MNPMVGSHSLAGVAPGRLPKAEATELAPKNRHRPSAEKPFRRGV